VTLSAQIEKLRADFEAIRADADSLVSGLSDAQLQWQPKPGTWSIVQCLAHLNSIDGQDLPNLYREITLGRKANLTAAGPFRWNWFERWFIATVEPPFRLKVPAPKKYLPTTIFNVRETILEFQRIQHDLFYLAAEADGLDLKKIKVVSPAASWLKMSLGARLDLIAAHDRRHLWQARKVREDANFPKS
jgi:hypothetical protein